MIIAALDYNSAFRYLSALIVGNEKAKSNFDTITEADKSSQEASKHSVESSKRSEEMNSLGNIASHLSQ